MYFSRVMIDTENRKKIRELDHLGAYHNWVESSFPKDTKEDRKVWRIDVLQEKKYLLIVSETKPDIDKLERYAVEGSAETKDYDGFLASLKNGQILRFKIDANPVISKSSGKQSGKRGRVFPHITEEQKMEYLKQRDRKNGFELMEDGFFISKSEFKILKKKNFPTIKISVTTFEGILKITDVDLFRNILVKGLGKKRAYGCGMMTVIPI